MLAKRSGLGRWQHGTLGEAEGADIRAPHLSNGFHTPHMALKQREPSGSQEAIRHNHNDLELCDLGQIPESLWVSVSLSVNWGHSHHSSQDCYEG